MTGLPGEPEPAPRTGESDPAKGRFLIIQALRWSGLALVMAGLLVINGKLDLPEITGYAMLAAGLLDALVMPGVLARKWKSPAP